MNNDSKKIMKKEWFKPELISLNSKKTRGGENPTWNESTAGTGYEEFPSQ